MGVGRRRATAIIDRESSKDNRPESPVEPPGSVLPASVMMHEAAGTLRLSDTSNLLSTVPQTGTPGSIPPRAISAILSEASHTTQPQPLAQSQLSSDQFSQSSGLNSPTQGLPGSGRGSGAKPPSLGRPPALGAREKVANVELSIIAGHNLGEGKGTLAKKRYVCEVQVMGTAGGSKSSNRLSTDAVAAQQPPSGGGKGGSVRWDNSFKVRMQQNGWYRIAVKEARQGPLPDQTVGKVELRLRETTLDVGTPLALPLPLQSEDMKGLCGGMIELSLCLLEAWT